MFIAIGIVVILVAFVIGGYLFSEDHIKTAFVVSFIGLALGIYLIAIGANSSSFKRTIKDYKSDLTGGIHRTIVVTAEDGREIYSYTGTIDLDLDTATRKIKFEDENGNRQIIVYGIQDTVTIIED